MAVLDHFWDSPKINTNTVQYTLEDQRSRLYDSDQDGFQNLDGATAQDDLYDMNESNEDVTLDDYGLNEDFIDNNVSVEAMPKGKYGTWSVDDMSRALQAFGNGDMGLIECCRQYGVPKPTLLRHLKGTNVKANKETKV
ncbi:hypothetical protein J6590_066856 [Homalodisca vitripennis]|nr:hypothetical protein J6590_066856 [Homalodisca vitripennis]